MAEQNDNDFPSSSPHRLPTVSATQALLQQSSTTHTPISTGLDFLDDILQARDCEGRSRTGAPGGVSRGQVTEIYGPPGVGKTSLAMQIAANALLGGDAVCWIDASYQLNGSRMSDIVSGLSRSRSNANNIEATKRLEGLHHFTTPTLPHLLSLLTHSSVGFPPPRTSLIVVDTISLPFGLAFPKTSERLADERTPVKKSDATQWAAGRRWAVMEGLMNDLGRLAVTKNIAIVLVSQTITRIREDARATLHPAIASAAWETGISNRIVLFRDWLYTVAESSSQRALKPGVRFAGVTKAQNVSYEGIGRLSTFTITKEGLREIDLSESAIRNESTLLPGALKRKREEIADSASSEEGESASDFGWDGDDAVLANDVGA